jgi:hypothetical protein
LYCVYTRQSLPQNRCGNRCWYQPRLMSSNPTVNRCLVCTPVTIGCGSYAKERLYDNASPQDAKLNRLSFCYYVTETLATIALTIASSTFAATVVPCEQCVTCAAFCGSRPLCTDKCQLINPMEIDSLIGRARPGRALGLAVQEARGAQLIHSANIPFRTD